MGEIIGTTIVGMVFILRIITLGAIIGFIIYIGEYLGLLRKQVKIHVFFIDEKWADDDWQKEHGNNLIYLMLNGFDVEWPYNFMPRRGETWRWQAYLPKKIKKGLEEKDRAKIDYMPMRINDIAWDENDKGEKTVYIYLEYDLSAI